MPRPVVIGVTITIPAQIEFTHDAIGTGRNTPRGAAP